MRCVACGASVPFLYKNYAKKTPAGASTSSSGSSIRLMRCEICGELADKYVEYQLLLVGIDLLLFKPQAYRHLLFNRLREQQPNTSASTGAVASSSTLAHLLLAVLLCPVTYLSTVAAATLFLPHSPELDHTTPPQGHAAPDHAPPARDGALPATADTLVAGTSTQHGIRRGRSSDITSRRHTRTAATLDSTQSLARDNAHAAANREMAHEAMGGVASTTGGAHQLIVKHEDRAPPSGMPRLLAVMRVLMLSSFLRGALPVLMIWKLELAAAHLINLLALTSNSLSINVFLDCHPVHAKITVLTGLVAKLAVAALIWGACIGWDASPIISAPGCTCSFMHFMSCAAVL
eukprot:jgi/Mesvir1/24391/Mv11059-RA.1